MLIACSLMLGAPCLASETWDSSEGGPFKPCFGLSGDKNKFVIPTGVRSPRRPTEVEGPAFSVSGYQSQFHATYSKLQNGNVNRAEIRLRLLPHKSDDLVRVHHADQLVMFFHYRQCM